MNDTPQTTLLTRAQAGDAYDTPPLATSSYWEYQRGWGTATRITRMAPRGQALPNPRWTDFHRWPSADLLAPGSDYFRKGLSPAEFRDRYLTDLNRHGAEKIAWCLRQVPLEDGRLVLLCYESVAEVTKTPWVCHRRIFAEWWQDLTGKEVPELSRQQAEPLLTIP